MSNFEMMYWFMGGGVVASILFFLAWLKWREDWLSQEENIAIYANKTEDALNENAQLKEQVAEILKERTELQEIIRDQDKQLTAKEKEITGQAETIKTLENEREGWKLSYEEAGETVNEAYGKIKTLEGKVEEAEEHEQKLYDKQIVKSNRIDELLDKLTQANERIAELEKAEAAWININALKGDK